MHLLYHLVFFLAFGLCFRYKVRATNTEHTMNKDLHGLQTTADWTLWSRVAFEPHGMILEPGELAPGRTVHTVDGRPLRLRDFNGIQAWQARPLAACLLWMLGYGPEIVFAVLRNVKNSGGLRLRALPRGARIVHDNNSEAAGS